MKNVSEKINDSLHYSTWIPLLNLTNESQHSNVIKRTDKHIWFLILRSIELVNNSVYDSVRRSIRDNK